MGDAAAPFSKAHGLGAIPTCIARTVEAFARVRPNVALSLLDDDHSLTKNLPHIWDGLSTFLEVE